MLTNKSQFISSWAPCRRTGGSRPRRRSAGQHRHPWPMGSTSRKGPGSSRRDLSRCQLSIIAIIASASTLILVFFPAQDEGLVGTLLTATIIRGESAVPQRSEIVAAGRKNRLTTGVGGPDGSDRRRRHPAWRDTELGSEAATAAARQSRKCPDEGGRRPDEAAPEGGRHQFSHGGSISKPFDGSGDCAQS